MNAGRRIAVCAAAVFSAAAAADTTLPLVNVADYALPGDTSRFDYESFDPSRHLLFLAHLGQSEVLAFDTSTGKMVQRIPGLAHVHGVLAIPELGRVYASATGSDEIVAIDSDKLTVIARIPGGNYPDGMAYAPVSRKLYVSDETGQTETVIDVRSNQRIATIPLGGVVGNSQYDPSSMHVFVNVQSRQQLVEIDPATDTVISRSKLEGAKGNHGLQIDPRLHLAFIACEDNDKLLVFDLSGRSIKARFDTGREPDVLAYDKALGLLYVASESGVLSLFKVDAGGIRKVGEGFVADNAHVVAVNPETHEAYLAIRNLQGRPVLKVVKPLLQ